MTPAAHPVLSCKEAAAWERRFLIGEEAEWAAMRRAGAAVARAMVREAREAGGLPAGARVLVLAGKGHNGGDALLAAAELRRMRPAARLTLVAVPGERAFRPLAARAWRELVSVTREPPVEMVRPADVVARLAAGERWDAVLDGLYGMQFRPPLDDASAALLEAINCAVGGLRFAVDLPSGLGAERDERAFRAHFTLATGIVKEPALDEANRDLVGRVRYLDLGFFDATEPPLVHAHVITRRALAPLQALRPAGMDKRSAGHVLLLAGSATLPGAALMATEAALRSGAGLVTTFVPERLATVFAARAPEAMWVPWPETPAGGLALEGLHLLRERLERASSLVIGPGLGRERETAALVGEVLQLARLPVVLDGDALQPDLLEKAGRVAERPLALTPHAGEFARLRRTGVMPVGAPELMDFALRHGAVCVLKGPVTRVSDGTGVWHSCFGGPVLARGGSGDVLAGLVGGRLAQGGPVRDRVLEAVAWQGLAADRLAREQGATAVVATDLLAHLGPVLREEADGA